MNIEREEYSEATADATEDNVEIMWADQGYAGNRAHFSAAAEGIGMVAVRVPETKRGFVRLPRRWIVERSFAWTAGFRRLAHDHGRLASSFVSMHLVAFSTRMLQRVF